MENKEIDNKLYSKLLLERILMQNQENIEIQRNINKQIIEQVNVKEVIDE